MAGKSTLPLFKIVQSQSVNEWVVEMQFIERMELRGLQIFECRF